MTYAVEVNK